MNRKKLMLIIKVLMVIVMGVTMVRLFSPTLDIVDASAELKVGDYVYFGEINGVFVKWRVASVDANNGVTLLPNDSVASPGSFSLNKFSKSVVFNSAEKDVLVKAGGNQGSSHIFYVQTNDVYGLNSKLNDRIPYNYAVPTEDVVEEDGEVEVKEEVITLLPAIFLDNNLYKTTVTLDGRGTSASPYIDANCTGFATKTEVISTGTAFEFGDTVTLSAKVSTVNSTIVKSGEVQFYINGTKVNEKATVGSNGTASLDVKMTEVGTVTIIAKYLGTPGYFESKDDMQAGLDVAVAPRMITKQDEPTVPSTEPSITPTEPEVEVPVDNGGNPNISTTPTEEHADSDFTLALGNNQTVYVYESGTATRISGDKTTGPGLYRTTSGLYAFCNDISISGPKSATAYSITGLLSSSSLTYKIVYVGMTNNYPQEAIMRAVHYTSPKFTNETNKAKWAASGDYHMNLALQLINAAKSATVPANGTAPGASSASISLTLESALTLSNGYYQGSILVRVQGSSFQVYASDSNVTLTRTAQIDSTTYRYTVRIPEAYAESVRNFTILGSATSTTGKGYAVWLAYAPGVQEMLIVEEVAPQPVSTSTSLNITVTSQKGNVRLIKVDAITNSPVTGCTFSLYHANGTLVGVSGSAGTYTSGGSITVLQTDSNGQLTVSNLAVGDYYFIEVSAPAPYVKLPVTTKGSFNVTTGGTAVVTMKNNLERGSILFKKIDSVTGQYEDVLADCEFTLSMTDRKTGVTKGVILTGTNGAYVFNDATLTTASPTATVFKVNASGQATISNLPIGEPYNGSPRYSYTVTETKAPSTYNKSAPITITIDTSTKTGTIIMQNTPKGSLEIYKRGELEDGTFSPLNGATFRITSTGGYNQTVTITQNGYIKITDLMPGTYTVTEIAAPPGYVIDPTPQTLVVGGNATATYRFDNRLMRGSLKLIKTDILTGAPVTGCTFALYKADGRGVIVSGTAGAYTYTKVNADTTTEPTTLETNAQGELTITNLPIGDYYIVELSAPRPYIIVSVNNKYETTIKYNETVTINVKNQLERGQLVFKKVDSATKEFVAALADCEFTLTMIDRKTNTSKVLGLTGSVGKYVFNDGNMLIANPTATKMKVDENGQIVITGLPIGEDYQGSPRYLYKVTEVSVPEEYEISAPVEATIDYPSKTVTITMENKLAQRRIRIIKVDENDDKILLAGAVFDIIDGNGDVVETLTTDSKGEATTKPLLLGTYYAIEKVAPDGYILNPERHKIELTASVTDFAIRVITNKPNKVELTKIDGDTRLTLTGAVIQILDSEGKVVHEGKSDTNGKILLTKLPAGTYTYKEIEAPPGYNLLLEEYTFTIDKHGVVSGKIIIENLRSKGQIVTISKRDVTDGKPVPGAKIEIFDAEGTLIFSGISDANGDTKFPMPKPGKYYFKETLAPDGYAINPEIFEFEITEDGIHKGVAIYDDDITRIQLRKVDAVSKRPLAGAVFGLYNEQNELVDQQTSGVDGLVTFERILYGTYLIKELKAPPGYSLTGEVILVNTKNGQYLNSGPYIFENPPSVQTGVDNMGLLVGAFVICLATAMVFVVARKKSNKAEQI